MYEPWDALQAPRFTGPRTYARLPHVKDLDGVDAAVFGMPWDGGASFRSGTRFGPEGIRSASGMIRTYNAVQRVQVFGELSSIDYGDSPTAPGYIEDTLSRIEDFVRPLAESAAVPIGMGGDHSVTLAELRALAAVHGPLGLIHLDSHTDLWDSYNGHPYATGRCSAGRSKRTCWTGHACCRQASAARFTARTTRPSRPSSAWRRSPGSTSRRCRRQSSPSAPAPGGRPARRSCLFDVDFVDPRSAPAPALPRWEGRPASRRSAPARTDGLPLRRLRRGRGRAAIRRARGR